MGNLTNLTRFYGNSNLFNGTFPTSVFSSLTRLRELELSKNSLVGAQSSAHRCPFGVFVWHRCGCSDVQEPARLAGRNQI